MTELNSNILAIERTKLANQRTFLAFIRTGFAISAIAGHFKKKYIFFFGVIMLILSTIQYIYITYALDNKVINQSINKTINYFIVIYSIIGVSVLYLQYNKKI
jgi:uncharacterized membrane protein YidH (DUF202 family)